MAKFFNNYDEHDWVALIAQGMGLLLVILIIVGSLLFISKNDDNKDCKTTIYVIAGSSRIPYHTSQIINETNKTIKFIDCHNQEVITISGDYIKTERR